MIVVSNSSPLIAFAELEQLELFPSVFSSIVIPPAVAREIAPSILTLPRWLRVEPLKTPLPERVVRPSLGGGERETLAIALEIQADRILLDDRIARRAADELRLVVTGTVGVLLAAKRHGSIHRVRPLVDLLVQKSFFVGPELYAEILRLAGEQDAG